MLDLLGIAVRLVIVAVITGLVVFCWTRINRDKPARAETLNSGTIVPGKTSAVIVTLFGIAIAVAGIALVLDNATFSGLACLIVGLALSIFMGLSLTHYHDLTWSSAGITGASKLFGPSLGVVRVSMRWDEVVAAGKTATSYWFIQSADGRRIYWSYLYPGYGRFVDRLKGQRPDIALPDDLI